MRDDPRQPTLRVTAAGVAAEAGRVHGDRTQARLPFGGAAPAPRGKRARVEAREDDPQPPPPAPPEDATCCVCMDAERAHALLPCLHRCVCETCAALLLAQGAPCPICRGNVTGHGRVYG